jgi:hypothetical protein
MSDISQRINSYEELQFQFDDEEELKKKSIENYLYYTYNIRAIPYFSNYTNIKPIIKKSEEKKDKCVL